MINTCFHIPTRLIYCSEPAGLQALLPSSSLSWHLYSAVFALLPPPHNITCTVCRQNQDRSVGPCTHTVVEATELQNLLFLISTLDVDSEGERWWDKVVVDLLSGLWSPNLSYFLLGLILSVSRLFLVLESQWLPEKQLIFKISFCWWKRPQCNFPLKSFFFGVRSLLQLLRPNCTFSSLFYSFLHVQIYLSQVKLFRSLR